jgi:hypothetical protein
MEGGSFFANFAILGWGGSHAGARSDEHGGYSSVCICLVTKKWRIIWDHFGTQFYRGLICF